LKSVILWRTKQGVLQELPKKSEVIVRVDQSELQRETYRNILTRNYEVLNKGVKGMLLAVPKLHPGRRYSSSCSAPLGFGLYTFLRSRRIYVAFLKRLCSRICLIRGQ
jgi:SNF2 family DNA or RNA helicase